MELKEFKDYVQNFKQGTEFEYGISDPFSWRGSYDEVAFEVLQRPMTREEILAKINKAYSETFSGYKGGEFTFDDYTPVNFEEDTGRYTDGGYCAEWIAKIEGSEMRQSQEERLVKLMFH